MRNLDGSYTKMSAEEVIRGCEEALRRIDRARAKMKSAHVRRLVRPGFTLFGRQWFRRTPAQALRKVETDRMEYFDYRWYAWEQRAICTNLIAQARSAKKGLVYVSTDSFAMFGGYL
jgi:hypothetical protein